MEHLFCTVEFCSQMGEKHFRVYGAIQEDTKMEVLEN